MAQLPSFIIEETFATSPETMYNLWTSPDHLQHWFGPLGAKVAYNRMELKKEGDYLVCLTNPDGSEHWGKWHFLDIIPNKKLIWLHSFSDKEGGLTRHPFHAEWPLQLLTEVDFETSGNGSKVRVSWTPYEAPENEVNAFAAALPSMNQGWGGTFHQLGNISVLYRLANFFAFFVLKFPVQSCFLLLALLRLKNNWANFQSIKYAGFNRLWAIALS